MDEGGDSGKVKGGGVLQNYKKLMLLLPICFKVVPM